MKRHNCFESGQVLVAGLFILIILLLLVFAGFDIHNALRARFKVQTAQEAAALTGATWQKHSLNLIGEINLVKACSVLMEGSNANWRRSLPDRNKFPYRYMSKEKFEEEYAEALQARMDVLTEMQTRISFIGPLIGFAAAQQAAKANGIKVLGDLQFYLYDLENNIRYREESGVKTYINNYNWRPPYMELIRTISANGIAVHPNTTANVAPDVDPPQLASAAFYHQIFRKADEINNAKGEAIYPQSDWGNDLKYFLSNSWENRFANPPWWHIDFNAAAFPNESEIFTLGVGVSETEIPLSGTPEAELLKNTAAQKLSSNNAENLYEGGTSLKMFCYERSTWDPEYLLKTRKDYEEDFYNYWFNGTVMRKKVKKQYIFEGPAAYTETHAEVGKTSSLIKIGGQTNYDSSTVRIGSNRKERTIHLSTDYRPGAIAKALGAFEDAQKPPIALPQVLPVFDKVIIMPTYMPIPYNFRVLLDYSSLLRDFLVWLSTKNDLSSDAGLPLGCASYLEALRILEKGPEFRYYGWNPNFDSAEFDKKWHKDLLKWHTERCSEPSKYQYNIKSGKNLPGYYQEPAIFRACSHISNCSGIVYVKSLSGEGYRHYIDNRYYMVVTTSNHIVRRGEGNPTSPLDCCTINYKYPVGGGGGGGGGHYVPTNGASTQRWKGL